MRTAVIAGACVVLMAPGCVPSTTEAERTFGENSPMTAIQAEGRLVVAVPPDSAPFAFTDEAGDPQGFVVDLARYLADALGVEAEFIEAPSEEMGRLVGGDEPREIGDQQADLAFPLTTITNQTYKADAGTLGFDVTTPYFVSHQRLLVPAGSPIEDVDDLAGKTVCSFIDPEVGVPLEKLQPEAEVLDVSSPVECAVALDKETVDAAAADEVDLLAVLHALEKRSGASGFHIVGDQATTQGYSPYVVRGMAAFASTVFNDVKDDGRWLEAYERWMTPLAGTTEVEAPPLTLEEAAALYPEVTTPPE